MSLDEPVRTKFSNKGGNARFDYGVSAMQGYREQMEDAHVALVNFDAASATSFFAVYDGHGGPAVAKYCAKHLHTKLRAHELFRSQVGTALEETFLKMDAKLRDRSAGKELSKYDVKGGRWKKYGMKKTLKTFVWCAERPVYEGPVDDGCTACVALIRGNEIFVANAGDSRCVISRDGQAIDLSTDHKPNVPTERQRIEAAGRNVTQQRGTAFRVDNGIATARAIGDLVYKNNVSLEARYQAVTAFPEVRSVEITAGTEFLVIACDGIWDCMSSQQVVDFVRIYINHAEPVNICASLLDLCVSQPRGIDNMSVILVKFKRHAQPAINRGVLPPPSQLPPPAQSQPPPAQSQPPLSQLPVVHATPDEKPKTGSAPSSFISGAGTSRTNKDTDDSKGSKSTEF